MALFTARLTSALLATAMMAFGAHAVFAPGRLPPVGGFSVVDLGLVEPQAILPQAVSAEDFAELRAQARSAREAAQPYITQWLAQNPQAVRRINIGVAGGALLLLLASMLLRLRRGTLRMWLLQRGAMTITT